MQRARNFSTTVTLTPPRQRETSGLTRSATASRRGRCPGARSDSRKRACPGRHRRARGTPFPRRVPVAVVVGIIEGEPAQLDCPCTLKLWEAGGPRTISIGNVTLPVSQQAAP